MKRTRKKLITEFWRLSDRFKYRGFKTSVYPYEIELYWGAFGGRDVRWKSVEQPLTTCSKSLEKTPLKILKQSVKFLHEKELSEKAKQDRYNT